MNRIAIGVIFGGCSTEYDVSLSSASAVIEQLNRDKYEAVPIGITRDGRWYRYYGDVDAIRGDRWHAQPCEQSQPRPRPLAVPALLSPSRDRQGLIELVGTEYRFTPLDVVFPVLHGRNGEDGTLQGLLELSGIPFVGCGSLSSAVCMDKVTAKTIVAAAGIGVPPYVAVRSGEDLEKAATAAETLGYPLYVKPARSGSSIGIVKAYDRTELVRGLYGALQHDDKAIVERHVDGAELGCAIAGNRANPATGTIDEIELSGEFFDYEEKYSLATSAIHLPARIDPQTADNARRLALRIYELLGCSGMARVDLFRTRDGGLLFNEVNTIPGFTPRSRYPRMMEAAGVGFPELLDRLVGDALAEARS